MTNILKPKNPNPNTIITIYHIIMAILKGDQRGEIKHQHEKAHYSAALVHV